MKDFRHSTATNAAPMTIIDGKVCFDGKGREVWIGGATRDNAAWCWSVQGNWYERATGRAIGYQQVAPKPDEKWEHFVREPSSDDIKSCTERSWK